MFIFRLKALATCCFALSLFLNTFCQPEQNRLVKDRFPGAQIWFEKMTQKYPVAKLDTVLFCVSDTYLSRINVIYWPECRLRAIDAAYATKKPYDLESMFKQDEYILLHEAAHILKNHIQNGYLALSLTCAAFAALNGYIAQKALKKEQSGTFNTLKLSTQALFGNLAILAALAQYVQIQEYEADDFANEYGDKIILQAGADWFMNLEKYMLSEQEYNDLIKSVILFYQDPWHPLPETRYQKILDTLALR